MKFLIDECLSPQCAAAPFRQFDFVVGRYELFGDNGQKAADEHVASEMHGCVIHEYSSAVNGDLSESYTFYDPAERAWFQYAVGLHLIFRVKGGIKNGALVLEGTSTHIRTADAHPFRIVWTPQSDGNISEQLFEQDPSTHQWRTTFSGRLVRVK